MDDVPLDLIAYAEERSYGKLYIHMWGLAKELGFKFGDDEKNINPANILSGDDLLSDCLRIFRHTSIDKYSDSENYKYLIETNFFKENKELSKLIYSFYKNDFFFVKCKILTIERNVGLWSLS
jgi:hypothetical protein